MHDALTKKTPKTVAPQKLRMHVLLSAAPCTLAERHGAWPGQLAAPCHRKNKAALYSRSLRYEDTERQMAYSRGVHGKHTKRCKARPSAPQTRVLNNHRQRQTKISNYLLFRNTKTAQSFARKLSIISKNKSFFRNSGWTRHPDKTPLCSSRKPLKPDTITVRAHDHPS